MASTKEFFFGLHLGDWYADAGVAALTSASRDIWHEALLRMHQRDRCGEISGTVEQLAVLCRASGDKRRVPSLSPEAQMREAIDELKVTNTAHVTERRGIVTLRNRRMYRDFRDRKSSTKRKQRQRAKERYGNVTGDVTDESRSLPSSFLLHPSSSPPKSPGSGADEREGSNDPKTREAITKMRARIARGA
jgi:hypothetical protein